MSNVNAIQPSNEFELVTKSDTAEQPSYRSIEALSSGNIDFEDHRGTRTLRPVIAGQILPLRPRIIYVTATTASLFGYL